MYTGAVAAKRKPEIDPRLVQALDAAGEDGLVEAVLMFRLRAAAKGAAAGVDDVQRLADDLAASEAAELNYFPNLRSLAIRGKGRVVRRLLEHPDLTVATVNRA